MGKPKHHKLSAKKEQSAQSNKHVLSESVLQNEQRQAKDPNSRDLMAIASGTDVNRFGGQDYNDQDGKGDLTTGSVYFASMADPPRAHLNDSGSILPIKDL